MKFIDKVKENWSNKEEKNQIKIHNFEMGEAPSNLDSYGLTKAKKTWRGLNKSIIFFKDANHENRISGGYQLEHPDRYDVSNLRELERELSMTLNTPCFGPLRFSWVFATAVQMEAAIKSMQRRAKEEQLEMV